ncbi:MAG: chromosome segregation protein SMC [Planctomycetota bacterium]
MLRALELSGFKSFADRTRFDFPDGITVVVGPNGSGKSNVVDAIKWVLGAQSAKALRGTDMTDVIFKGSAPGGRKPANSAEVTLVLDNRKRILPTELDEVQVSRRVYRSGEGEYAINGRPCRLKDVRELFRGTGVGFDAYSLIEQGKVDRLLQSSAKDRRAIFEEAAGISRFKARKAEAEKRIARVDTNMLRLHDIVEEVGGRLQSLKSQATRAQRYRELNSKMQIQRRRLGLLERKDLENQLAKANQQVHQALEHKEQFTAQLATIENDLQNAVLAVQASQESLEDCNQRIIELQTFYAQRTGELSSARQRHSEWLAEQANLQDRIESLERRVSISQEEINDRNGELAELNTQRDSMAESLALIDQRCKDYDQQLNSQRSSLDQLRLDQQNLRDKISKCKYDSSLLDTQLDQLAEAIQRQTLESESLTQRIQELQIEADRLSAEKNQASEQQHRAIANRESAKSHLHEITQLKDHQLQELLDLQSQIQGLRERHKVLEEIEEQFATAGKGGQQLIRAVGERVEQKSKEHVYSLETNMVERAAKTISGIVADLITSELHLAPLVDVALGSHADAVVLADGQLVDWIQDGRLEPDGRVTLLRLDRLPARRTGEKIQLDGLRGVLGRADRLVRYDTAHEPLVRSLLGTTWFVESLTTALELSHLRGAGLRFVTAECQLVDSDGSITIGSLQAGLGLVSRRSEMQAAEEQIEDLHKQHFQAKSILEQTQREHQIALDQVREAEQEVFTTQRLVESIHERAAALGTRSEDLGKQLQAKREQTSKQLHSQSALQDLLDECQRDLNLLNDQSQEIQQSLTLSENEFETIERDSRTWNSDLVEKRVATARLEQRIDGLRTTLDQLLNDSHERQNHVQAAKDSLHNLAQRIVDITESIDRLKDQLSDQDQHLAALQQARTHAAASVDSKQFELHSILQNRDGLQRQIDKWTDRLANYEQEQTRVGDEISAFVSRYLNDYQIDLDAQDPQIDPSMDEPLDRYALESQIGALRHEIQVTGSVNLEALDELEQLQSRYDTLAGHEKDLLETKATLIKTMQKIDADSQTLFVETLEKIRANFQALYRKSFGGGFADIVLENPEDPESGIEILATPPGKTTFSNNLLSGGEKALTAVSLIMAFFQHRPSPFCVLDEVDAPFDEANIGRFVNVLNEFLDSTKFIIVTHSKKTMTAADVIYGITMQESGVSRQVSVKFEEVDDRGQIALSENKAA